MRCCRSDWSGLGFACFVVINPRVLSANRVDFCAFLFHTFSNFTHPPPPQHVTRIVNILTTYLSTSTDNTNDALFGVSDVLNVGKGGSLHLVSL